MVVVVSEKRKREVHVGSDARPGVNFVVWSYSFDAEVTTLHEQGLTVSWEGK